MVPFLRSYHMCDLSKLRDMNLLMLYISTDTAYSGHEKDLLIHFIELQNFAFIVL